MHSRAFLFLLLGLFLLVVATTPSFLGPLLWGEATSTPVIATSPPTLTPTNTPDPLAKVPTATPIGRGKTVFQPLPPPALGTLPPTVTPEPNISVSFTPVSATTSAASPAAPQPLVSPTPQGDPPTRLAIPRLNLDIPVETVGMLPSTVAPGVYEWAVPDYRAAGWLDTSAGFGRPGNTVLDGHHNIKGEAFRDLWTLQPGDAIFLYAGDQARQYHVGEVLILPERDQPLEVRLNNARYIQPTDDERVTLITCWPYENNTHRVVVVAFPTQPVSARR